MGPGWATSLARQGLFVPLAVAVMLAGPARGQSQQAPVQAAPGGAEPKETPSKTIPKAAARKVERKAPTAAMEEIPDGPDGQVVIDTSDDKSYCVSSAITLLPLTKRGQDPSKGKSLIAKGVGLNRFIGILAGGPEPPVPLQVKPGRYAVIGIACSQGNMTRRLTGIMAMLTVRPGEIVNAGKLRVTRPSQSSVPSGFVRISVEPIDAKVIGRLDSSTVARLVDRPMQIVGPVERPVGSKR